MLWRSKSRKNRTDDQTDNRITLEKQQEMERAAQQEAFEAPEVPEASEVPEENLIQNETEEPAKQMSREELLMQNEEARRMYENILNLRKSVESLRIEDEEPDAKSKASGQVREPEGQKIEGNKHEEDSEEVIAAKRAIMERAKADEEKERLRLEEARKRELQIQQERIRVMEAEKKAAMISEEAERKRIEALEAEKHAKEVARKKALEIMEAERKAREELLTKQHSASQEEMAAFFGKKNTEEKPKDPRSEISIEELEGHMEIPQDVNDLDKLKETLLTEQAKQGHFFNKISEIAGQKTGEMSEVTKAKAEEVAEAHRKAREEQEYRLQLQQLRAEQEKAKAEQIAMEKARQAEIARVQQAALEKAEQEKRAAEELMRIQEAEAIAAREAKEEEERLLEIAKAEKAKKAYAEMVAKAKAEKAQQRLDEKQKRREKVRAERVAKVARKRAERARKAEAKERLKLEKKRRAQEKARLIAEREADAELGGGIVNIKGLQISTKLNKKPHFTLRDFFGFMTRAEKKAESKEEKKALKAEREERRQKARAAAVLLSIQRKYKYENSKWGKRVIVFKDYCEEHKKPLITGLAAVIMLVVGTAGVFNYCTAYEYAYNGKVLGVVEEKDDVLRITDLVQGALTEEMNMDIVIDAKDDISFNRVYALGDVKIDTSEDVLKRLTYMGDLNVKAYGIYVNGKKVGAVQDKKTAGNVMQSIKDKYTGSMEGAKVEEAVFIEKVEVRKSNTDLEDLHTEEEMVEILSTSGKKETIHKVVAGDTLNSIANLYSMTEEDILKDNKGLDSKKLKLGSGIVIKQNAPLLTVKITELVTYDKVIEHEVENVDSKDIYEGYTETKQKGEDGISEVTSRVVTVNGETIEETNLVTTVKKEPVTEVILVGTKERPPTVGSGKYTWPLKDGFRQTSGFGARWGSQHKGVDLACPVGTNVYAADGGTVIKAGYFGTYGNVVIIDHQNGQETRYAHNSKLLVKAGDKVFQGQHIAESGNTGRSTGPHLHFEIRIGGAVKNPLKYLP